MGAGDISWGSMRPGPLSSRPRLPPPPHPHPTREAILTDPHLSRKFLSSQMGMGREGGHPNLLRLAVELPPL